jgi:uncharacterized protein (DUF1501 family)
MKRRYFVKSSVAAGVAAATFGNIFDPLSVKAYANGPLLARMAKAAGSNRVLVIVQLDGGNDGLNTIVPAQDANYFNARGALAINDSLKLNDTLGWHPMLGKFKTMYDEGNCAVVQNVGYENPNRSHFRSTDVWFSGSDSQSVLDDGWLGRYLDIANPNYPDVAPEHPLALKIGTTTNLMIEGPNVTMGMAIADPEVFYQIISGTDISQGDPPDLSTPGGQELAYIRQIAVEANTYATPVREAANTAANHDVYPTERNTVADQLKIVARLVAGGLETPIYITRQGGYDTHASQETRHEDLLETLSEGIGAFFQDLKLHGVDDRVVLMTISEFGRRVKANGTAGTDHGTTAPMLFFGPQVNGGVFGNNPDLANLDRRGDYVYQYDFKQTYASVLEQWFSVKESDTALVLNGDWDTLPLFALDPTTAQPANAANGFALHQNYPNPVSQAAGAMTSIRFTTNGGQTALRVYDIKGREVKTLVNANLAPGSHETMFNGSQLPSGTYLYRLEHRGLAETRRLVLTK